ncbi:hypothetical protein [Citrobacter koseri]|nr:hypothetical protein [Citrobacter koseri]
MSEMKMLLQPNEMTMKHSPDAGIYITGFAVQVNARDQYAIARKY